MKPIFRYGLFAVALLGAVCAGYFFAEQNNKTKHEVVNSTDDLDTKKGSGDDKQTSSESPSVNQPVAQTIINKTYKVYPKNTTNSSSDTQDNPAPVEQAKSALDDAAHSQSAKIDIENNQERGDSYIVPVSSNVSVSDILNTLAELPNTIDGKPFGTQKIENKVLIVAFWASWCGPCRYELREIDQLIKKISNPKLEMVAVSVEEDIAASRQFLRKIFPEITSLSAVSDIQNKLVEQVKLDAMPTVLIVNPHTRSSVKIYKGYTPGDAAQYEQQLKDLGITAQPAAQSIE